MLWKPEEILRTYFASFSFNTFICVRNQAKLKNKWSYNSIINFSVHFQIVYCRFKNTWKLWKKVSLCHNYICNWQCKRSSIQSLCVCVCVWACTHSYLSMCVITTLPYTKLYQFHWYSIEDLLVVIIFHRYKVKKVNIGLTACQKLPVSHRTWSFTIMFKRTCCWPLS